MLSIVQSRPLLFNLLLNATRLAMSVELERAGASSKRAKYHSSPGLIYAASDMLGYQDKTRPERR